MVAKNQSQLTADSIGKMHTGTARLAARNNHWGEGAIYRDSTLTKAGQFNNSHERGSDRYRSRTLIF